MCDKVQMELGILHSYSNDDGVCARLKPQAMEIATNEPMPSKDIPSLPVKPDCGAASCETWLALTSTAWIGELVPVPHIGCLDRHQVVPDISTPETRRPLRSYRAALTLCS